MIFKGTASALLRARINSAGEMSDLGRRNDHAQTLGTNPWLSQVCWLMYLLSTVEIASRNYEEAAIHTRMIMKFMESEDPSMRVGLRLDVINAISYWDLQRASITLSPPCFNPGRWAADHLRIPWEHLVALEVPASSASPINVIDVVGSCPDLCLAWPFATIRESRNIARTLPLLPISSNFEELRLHFSVWNNVHEAIVVNEYLKMPKNCDSLTAASAVHLACLYWMRRLVSAESSGPSRVAVAGPTILHKLNTIFDKEMGTNNGRSPAPFIQSPLRRGLSQESSELRCDDSKLRLWVLYVSAMVEKTTVPMARLQRFSIEFLNQARMMQYKTWRQVRDEVLQLFLYDEELDPAGDSWHEKMVGVPLEQLQSF